MPAPALWQAPSKPAPVFSRSGLPRSPLPTLQLGAGRRPTVRARATHALAVDPYTVNVATAPAPPALPAPAGLPALPALPVPPAAAAPAPRRAHRPPSRPRWRRPDWL